MNRLRQAVSHGSNELVQRVRSRRGGTSAAVDHPSDVATPSADRTELPADVPKPAADNPEPSGSTADPSADAVTRPSDAPPRPRPADVVDLAVRPTDVDSIDIGSDLPDTAWRQKGGLRPSYMYKLHESKRRKLLLNTYGHRQRIWSYNDKRAGYEFAESAGVSVPETIIESAEMTDVDWSELPDRFVVKPRNGAANRGVYLLERTSDGGYRDLMRSDTSGSDEIIARYADLVDRGLISANCTVEELLAPRPELRDRIDAPDDFKVYCFYDRAAVIMQRRMHGRPDPKDWKFKFWTRAWDDLGAVKYAERCDPDLERPGGADELVVAAEQIGRKLAVPFARLDLFDTDRGIVFGEVTPHPGPPEVWVPEVDELLGREWENAETRLMAEGISPSVTAP